MLASTFKVPGVANTPKPITSDSTPAAWAVIQARAANADSIRVGDSTITSTSGGTLLAAGGSIAMPFQGGPGAYDLSDIYLVAGNTTDGVDVNYA